MSSATRRSTRDQIAYWRSSEDARLQGLSLLAQLIYLRGLRRYVDRNGVVGRWRAISWKMLAELTEFSPDRGSTKGAWQASREEIRAALRELQRHHLIQDLGESARFQGLVFLLPLAVPQQEENAVQTSSHAPLSNPLEPLEQQPTQELTVEVAEPVCLAASEVPNEPGSTHLDEPPATPSITPISTPTTPQQPELAEQAATKNTTAAVDVSGKGVLLYYPEKFSNQQRLAAWRMLEKLPPEHAQAVLDEMSAALAIPNKIHSPLGYLRGCVRHANNGSFVPVLGLAVAKARQQATIASTQSPVSASSTSNKASGKGLTAAQRERIQRRLADLILEMEKPDLAHSYRYEVMCEYRQLDSLLRQRVA